jgi:P27 family predicted phage terminase small subunit
MPRGGHNRKPKIIKMNQGTFRKDRNPKNEPEPTPAHEMRRPPSNLNKWGKRFWKEISTELVDSGIVTEIDWHTLEMCAAAYGTFRECLDSIYHEDLPDGKRRKRTLAEYIGENNSHTTPLLSTLHKAFDQYHKYSSSLGLNPVARNKIDLKEPKSDYVDPMEELFNDE